MKTLAFLLAIFISFLAIEPGMNALVSKVFDMKAGCCTTTCTPLSDDFTTEGQEQNDDCHGKTCNPFKVCSSCVLLVDRVVCYDALFKPSDTFDPVFSYYSAFSSSFVSDFWQPPKFV